MLLHLLLLTGHVLDASTGRPVAGARVTAWPAMEVVIADSEGFFEVEADSIVVEAWGYTTVRWVADADHVDVWMQPLAVELSVAEVGATSGEEATRAAVGEGSQVRAPREGGWSEWIRAAPGVVATELGAGSFSPIVRGLQGTRIAVVSDGVPLQGARWGADHGVLADPELAGSAAVVRGGGAVWLGPEAVAGAVVFQEVPPLPEEGADAACAVSGRSGDGRMGLVATARVRSGRVQWRAGCGATAFGDRNVRATTFTYLGRVLPLENNRLVNTSGTTVSGKVGFDAWPRHGGRWRGGIEAFAVNSGLFPGIIGTPIEADLADDGARYGTILPRSTGSRITTTIERDGARGTLFRISGSMLDRTEWAPPHAHGWGPEPADALALRIAERTAFSEVRVPVGPAWVVGFQTEGLLATTSGWEFLLADHRTGRISGGATWARAGWSAGLRADAVHRSGGGHEEPLYGPDGEVVGTDVRAAPYRKNFTGATATLHRAGAAGEATVVVGTRFPDAYALGADGIHHGTFRFERGNAALRPEHVAEVRWGGKWERGRVRCTVDGFGAAHAGFIYLRPTGAFAPIAHAGQIYSFTATPAFRTGGEAHLAVSTGRRGGSLEASGGWSPGWDLATGFALPFTPPPRVRLSILPGTRTWGRTSLSGRIDVDRVGEARLVARNEATTPGYTLIGASGTLQRGAWTVTLVGRNLARAVALDHTSAYRALGLPMQDRTVTVRIAKQFSSLTRIQPINSK